MSLIRLILLARSFKMKTGNTLLFFVTLTTTPHAPKSF
jgi:hypothetical protein